MQSLTKFFTSASAVSFAVLASAQMNPAPTVSLKILSPTVAANKTVSGILTVTFATGLHGYQNPPTDPNLIPVSVTDKDALFKLLNVKYPKGTPQKMGGEDKPVNVYEGTIQIPVKLQAPAKVGKTTIKLLFSYQQCNDQSCFPPGEVSVQGTVNVVKVLPPAKSH